jgi:hypothetical protein
MIEREQNSGCLKYYIMLPIRLILVHCFATIHWMAVLFGSQFFFF